MSDVAAVPATDAAPQGPLALRDQPWILLLIGAATGFLGALLGIGGGVIVIPLLVFVVGQDQRNAQGTSLALSIPLVAVNCVNYYLDSPPRVFWNTEATLVSGLIALGGMGGSLIGSKLALAMPVKLLGRIFAGVMAAAGIYMLVKGLKTSTLVPQEPWLRNFPRSRSRWYRC